MSRIIHQLEMSSTFLANTVLHPTAAMLTAELDITADITELKNIKNQLAIEEETIIKNLKVIEDAIIRARGKETALQDEYGGCACPDCKLWNSIKPNSKL